MHVAKTKIPSPYFARLVWSGGIVPGKWYDNETGIGDEPGETLKLKYTNSAKEKKIYCKPELTTYGGIAELTRTQAGDCQDNENAFNNSQEDSTIDPCS